MFIIITFWDTDPDKMVLETADTLTTAKLAADDIVGAFDSKDLLRIYDEDGTLLLSYKTDEGFMTTMAGVRAFRAARLPEGNGMKNAMQLILPDDIDTSKHFFNAFDKQEREVSARYIVRFCQKRGSWDNFTHEDINGFYKEWGMNDGFWMNGLEGYGIVPDDTTSRNPTYTIHHIFVARCYEASPIEVAEKE